MPRNTHTVNTKWNENDLDVWTPWEQLELESTQTGVIVWPDPSWNTTCINDLSHQSHLNLLSFDRLQIMESRLSIIRLEYLRLKSCYMTMTGCMIWCCCYIILSPSRQDCNGRAIGKYLGRLLKGVNRVCSPLLPLSGRSPPWWRNEMGAWFLLLKLRSSWWSVLIQPENNSLNYLLDY